MKQAATQERTIAASINRDGRARGNGIRQDEGGDAYGGEGGGGAETMVMSCAGVGASGDDKKSRRSTTIDRSETGSTRVK
eukprot:6318934-Alexandrium_andersonii.AAC.1